jgi:hypothetical protein
MPEVSKTFCAKHHEILVDGDIASVSVYKTEFCSEQTLDVATNGFITVMRFIGH